MDILITGNLSAGIPELSQQLFNNNKLIFAAKDITKDNLNKEAITFNYDPDEPMFEKLFKSYSFGAVIFFAGRREQRKDNQKKQVCTDDLSTVLSLCSEHKIPQVICVSSSEVYAGNETISEKATPAPASVTGQILASAESLCDFYRQSKELGIVTLHIPYLYGNEPSDNFLTCVLEEADKKGSVTLPGARDRLCDFIKDTDLARLIGKIVDEGSDSLRSVINVGTGKPITFSDFAQLLDKQFPGIKINYSGDESSVPPPMPVETAREYYDWTALYELDTEFDEIANNILSKARQKKKARSIDRKKSSWRRVLIQAIEIVLGFFLMEYLNRITETSVLFRFVDFRLLYVIVLGSVHGMFSGIVAAALACVSCLIGYSSEGLGWQVLIYNINNWLPFIAYIIAGVVTGYNKDKSNNSLLFQKKQLESFEERYLFLYELYEQTLKNKGQYKDQLMGYRDSFGRIYSITQKLDTVISDVVFQEAVNILEDVLDNRTIAIYTVTQDKKFARLAVCSSEMSDNTGKSINLSDYSIMLNQISKNDVWYNKDIVKGYPAYCVPVYDRDNLIVLIFIYKADFNQMSIYYLNLIKVLSGLIQASLVRAANFDAVTEDKNYIAGTNILKNEKFSSIYSVRLKMKESQISDFILLRVEYPQNDLVELGKLIDRGIRETDVAGMGKDWNVYLILYQAKEGNLGIILKRLEDLGVRCHQIESLQAAAI